MKITPLDVQKHEFPIGRRGYNPEEVRAFLQLISEELEAAVRESMDLRDRVNALNDEVQEFRSREKILKNTLLTAQKMSEDVKEMANKEASLIIKEAELKAERVISTAQVRATQIESSTTELKIQRSQFRMRVQSAVEQLREVLRIQEEEDERDEKFRFMKKTEELIGKSPPAATGPAPSRPGAVAAPQPGAVAAPQPGAVAAPQPGAVAAPQPGAQPLRNPGTGKQPA